MNTRTWLVLGCIAFYIWWVNQSAAQTISPGAAGTPTGATPVSSIAVTPQAPTTGVSTLQAITNTITNSLNPAPTVAAVQTGSAGFVGFDHINSPVWGANPLISAYAD